MATETIIQKESPAIEAYKLGLMEQAKNLVDAPPVGGLPAITSQGMTTAQTDALTAAEQGLGAFQPYLDTGQATLAAGQTALTGAMGAPTQAQLDAYMNPYQQAIGDEITRAFDMQRAQAAQQAAAQGAFGGGRAAIQQAEIGRNEAAALAKAQADNFLQAQAAAQAELDRNLATGQALGSLGVQQAGIGELATRLGIADTQNVFQLGEAERAILQAQDEAARQTEMQDIYEPYQRLGVYGDILAGAPTSQQQISQSASPDPSLLNQIVGGATSALGLYGAGKGTGLI